MPDPTPAPPPALAPGAPSDAIISDGVSAFLNANPLNPNPAAAPAAPQPAPTPAPAPSAAALAPTPAQPPPAAPQPLRPFDLQEMIKSASPGAAEPTLPAAEPAIAEGESSGESDLSDAPPEARKEGSPQANAWTSIKRDLKQVRAENAQLKTRVAEAEAKASAAPAVDPQVVTEVETLRKQVDDYENQIGQIEITRSQTFQQRYDAPVRNLRAKAVRNLAMLSERTPEDTTAMLQALEQAPSLAEARQMLGGESPDVRSAALMALSEIKEALGTREQAIQDWRNTLPAIETEADRVSEGETLSRIVDTTSSALKEMARPLEEKGAGSWIYMDIPDDVEWAARKQSLVSVARSACRDAKVVPTPELAKIILDGVAAPSYREFGEKQYRRAQELEGILARRNRAIPRVQGGETGERTPAPNTPVVVKPLDPQSTLDTMLRNFKQANG